MNGFAPGKCKVRHARQRGVESILGEPGLDIVDWVRRIRPEYRVGRFGSLDWIGGIGIEYWIYRIRTFSRLRWLGGICYFGGFDWIGWLRWFSRQSSLEGGLISSKEA